MEGQQISYRIQNQIVEDSSITPPPKKNVVFYNDDFTTMEFVVEVLVAIYNKSKEDAEKIMKTVHNEGLCVVGTYTYDIAVSYKADDEDIVIRYTDFDTLKKINEI